jgi:hypothetical protein
VQQRKDYCPWVPNHCGKCRRTAFHALIAAGLDVPGYAPESVQEPAPPKLFKVRRGYR